MEVSSNPNVDQKESMLERFFRDTRLYYLVILSLFLLFYNAPRRGEGALYYLSKATGFVTDRVA